MRAVAPVRVAFVGKGGAGKSAIAGVFCRLLAQQTGGQVVAIDSDPMPGLAVSLGLASEDTPLPAELVEKVSDGGDPPVETWHLRGERPVLDVVGRYAAEAPDGVRVLQFGKLRGHVRVLGASQQAFRVVVRELAGTDAHLVGDLPGGTRQPFFGWADFADVIVVVAEATAASMLSAKRLARLAAASDDGEQRVVAAANKVTDPSDAQRLAEFSGLDVVAVVPRDPAVGSAEREGVSLLEHAPEAPAVGAIRSLVNTLSGGKG